MIFTTKVETKQSIKELNEGSIPKHHDVKLYINPDHIVSIMDEGVKGSLIRLTNGNYVVVKELFESVVYGQKK